MNNKGRVYFDRLTVADKKFTTEKMSRWEKHLMTAYKEILEEILEEKDPVCQISFAMNPSLLDDAIVDAVLGLKKITQSSNNNVGDPNTFKVVAYVMYWFLRHKPVQIFLQPGVWIENVTVRNPKDYKSEQELKEANNKLAWKIKHINEYVAVSYAISHIFNEDVEVFDDEDFERLKKAQNEKISFNSFEEMTDALVDKLIYYVSYRAIAPKILEHFLEGYTYYPNHGLTDAHWAY